LIQQQAAPHTSSGIDALPPVAAGAEANKQQAAPCTSSAAHELPPAAAGAGAEVNKQQAAPCTSSAAHELSLVPAPVAAGAEANKPQAALLLDKPSSSQKPTATAFAAPCANVAGGQGAEQQHNEHSEMDIDLCGKAFAVDQQLIMSSGYSGFKSSQRLLLQVEQYIARGGAADLYRVKLLQQQASGKSTAQPAAAAAAAGTTTPAAAPLQQQLAVGQSYALKVARSLDTFPADVVEGKSNAAFLKRMRNLLQCEWEVLQDLAACRNIINAYSFGQVTAAGAASRTADGPSASAAAGSTEHQQHAPTSPGQQQQQELDSTHAGLEAPAAALVLPCILMDFADGGCAGDAVYTQHGRPTPLPADETRKVLQGVMQGLREMHRQA
jgi:hypothetical protein